MHGFFAMGGYGAYVWGAYGVAAVVVAVLVTATLARRRQSMRRLAALESLRRVGPGETRS
jgi:heme exporter protein D